ncbi:MAG: sensor histidine kinase [Akkermansiaceae bacterium]
MSNESKPILRALLFVLSWFFVVLVFAAQLKYGGEGWRDSFVMSFFLWFPWVVFSPVIIFLSLRLPLVCRRWKRNFVVHVLVCLLMLYVTQFFPDSGHRVESVERSSSTEERDDLSGEMGAEGVGEDDFLYESFDHRPPPPYYGSPRPPHPGPHPPYGPPVFESEPQYIKVITVVSHTALVGIPIYVAIAFLTGVMFYRSELVRREKLAHLLEANLSQAKLDVLTSQLQPHFLFNTLNSISALIHLAPDKADTMVIQLSDLLRTTLAQRDQKMISVSKEVEMLENYLNIQSTRFGARMRVVYEIEPELMGACIPPMIMLPLVENAIRYGVEMVSTEVEIKIEVKLVDRRLVASISDNGPGLSDDVEGGTGIGLENIKQRLRLLFPDGDGELRVIDNDGVTAILTIPHRKYD